ncbi:MAG: prolipoprotein diacylglyceryl transferase [Acutalibacteraceae bacterium]|nr:prolipoprotein diacylglyceryl transferase [Acutalibacteraceae bacterium]
MSYDVTIFGLHLTLKPIAFTLPIGGGWDIYWYGIIIALGFTLAIIYGIKNAPRFNVNVDRMLDVAIVTTPVAILCARAYYVIFDGVKCNSISDFFGFGSSNGFSGIAIYGGVIGAFACGALMCKIRKIKILDMFDLASVGFLIGQGIGRWGNFVNQEAYGSFTGSSWWGMESTRTIAEMGEGLVHPCFLYESVWCIIGFFVLNHLSKKRQFSGEIALCYCVWYGFERSIVENLRTDSLMIGNIRVSVLVSVIICISALVTLIVIRKKQKAVIADGDYTSMFESEEETAEESLEEKEETNE